MESNKRTKAEKAAEVSASSALAAVKAGVAAASSGVSVAGAAVGAGGLVLVPTVAAGVLGWAFAAQSRRVQKKVDRWWGLVSDYLELGSVEAAAAEIREHIDEPWAHEAVIEATRRILDDIDEAALPFLARLTAAAVNGRRVPNDRDRSAAALLVIRRAGLLEALRSFVLECNRLWPKGVVGVEATVMTEGTGAQTMESTSPHQSAKLSVVLKAASPPSEVSFPANAVVFDLITALKRHGFAFDNPGGFYGVQTGPHVATLQKADIEFLGEVLR